VSIFSPLRLSHLLSSLKGEIVPVNAVNDTERVEDRRMAPFILNPGARREVSGQLHAPAASPPRKNYGAHRIGGLFITKSFPTDSFIVVEF